MVQSAQENEKPEPFSHRKKVRIFLIWWARVDSNHRSIKQQIYSLSPLATREHAHILFCHPAFVLPADLFILPQLRRFVKKFFQLSFFDLRCVPARAGLLAYSITGGRFCQRVISAFFAPAAKYLKNLFGLVFFSFLLYNELQRQKRLGEGFGDSRRHLPDRDG